MNGKRWRANVPSGGNTLWESTEIIGKRVIVAGRYIVEEWDTTTGRGKSMIPRKIAPVEPRAGIVKMTQRRDEETWTVVLDDVPPLAATVGSILSIMQPRLVCNLGEVYDLLAHLVGKPVMTHQLPDLATQVEPWLRERFPRYTEITVPELADESHYRAWMAGLVEGLGRSHEMVWAPTITFTVPTFVESLQRVRDLAIEANGNPQ